MPETKIRYFVDIEGRELYIEWFESLPLDVQIKIRAKIALLAESGHELRRPHADYLRDGIYELRVAHKRIQYRILYFFLGKEIVISHGFIKRADRVPDREIVTAVNRKAEYEKE